MKEIFAIEKEAKTEWKSISSRFTPKGGDEKAVEEEGEDAKNAKEEEHVNAYRRFIGGTYVNKMKSCLGGLEAEAAAAGEIETMKRGLRMVWKDLGKMSVQELDEMEERY